MANITDTLEIISPQSKNSKIISGSYLIGEALEWMIMKAPYYDATETNFAVQKEQIVNPNSISICSIYGKLGVLFNWTSLTNKEYSAVVLSSDSINFKEIKRIYTAKEDF